MLLQSFLQCFLLNFLRNCWLQIPVGGCYIIPIRWWDLTSTWGVNFEPECISCYLCPSSSAHSVFYMFRKPQGTFLLSTGLPLFTDRAGTCLISEVAGSYLPDEMCHQCVCHCHVKWYELCPRTREWHEPCFTYLFDWALTIISNGSLGTTLIARFMGPTWGPR